MAYASYIVYGLRRKEGAAFPAAEPYRFIDRLETGLGLLEANKVSVHLHPFGGITDGVR